MHIGPQRLCLKTVDCVPFLSSSGAKVMLTQGGGGHALRKRPRKCEGPQQRIVRGYPDGSLVYACHSSMNGRGTPCTAQESPAPGFRRLCRGPGMASHIPSRI